MNPGFEEIMSIRGRGMPADGEVSIAGADPVFSARFKVGETTANILAGTCGNTARTRTRGGS